MFTDELLGMTRGLISGKAAAKLHLALTSFYDLTTKLLQLKATSLFGSKRIDRNCGRPAESTSLRSDPASTGENAKVTWNKTWKKWTRSGRWMQPEMPVKLKLSGLCHGKVWGDADKSGGKWRRRLVWKKIGEARQEILNSDLSNYKWVSANMSLYDMRIRYFYLLSWAYIHLYICMLYTSAF